MPSSDEEFKMLSLAGDARIFLCTQPTSMHKSFEGLSAIIEELFPDELLSGAFFVFFNRTKSCLKVLYWDGDGFAIWYKRLEKGSFLWKENSSSPLTRRAFFMLLEGITPKRIQKRFSL